MENLTAKPIHENIITLVCEYFGVDRDELNNKKKDRQSAYRRWVCWYMIKKNTQMTFQTIGNHFNTKHSTIQDGYKGLEDLLSYERLTIVNVRDLQKVIDNFNLVKLDQLLNKEWPTLPNNTTR